MDNGTDRNGWMRVALDATRDAVVALDGEGRVTFMNRAAEDLAGVDEDNALGRPLASFLRPLDEDSHRPVELAPGKPLRRSLLLDDRHIEATLEPLREEDGAGAVLVMRDVSVRRRMEEELRRRAEELAGADRRKDQFLAMLAHELRNPLAPIRNAVELMRQVENIDPAFQRSREMVERQVKHLARLVDDLLDISRITRGSIRLRKEVVTLADAVDRAVEANRPLLESRSHKLYVQLPPEPIRLEADPARLEQILSNLLDNAARYTMPGGQIWVAATQEGDEALIRVRDTGIGVPPDVLERVFEPFMQSDDSLARTDGGLGVGLTLVRSLVEMHGGRVEAHSPGLGQGSEFVIRLPARVPADLAVPAAEPAAAAARSLKVLVVEDNVDAAESLASLLRLWNHDVSVVHDGRSALEAARAHHPEVVLLDIGLPGLDGYQVAQRLRDEIGLDHTLLVAMTGYGQPEDRRRSREAGIHHHFVKPVEPAVLRNLLAGVGVPA
jgi:PAS domain S-box-containing protein